jgi:hypothetical protein
MPSQDNCGGEIMIDPTKDGVDHINIYSQGKTSPGRALSNFTRHPTVIEGVTFESLEGYWYWLSTGQKHNDLCKLYGAFAKKIGKSYETVYMDQEKFRDKIKQAMKLKLEQWPNLRQPLKESTLPFKYYYVFGGKVVDAHYLWIVEEWDRLREELRGESNCKCGKIGVFPTDLGRMCAECYATYLCEDKHYNIKEVGE